MERVALLSEQAVTVELSACHPPWARVPNAPAEPAPGSPALADAAAWSGRIVEALRQTAET
jgi:hypothetical protein